MISRKGFKLENIDGVFRKTYPIARRDHYGLVNRWLPEKSTREKYVELISKLHPGYILDAKEIDGDFIVDYKFITGIPAINIFKDANTFFDNTDYLLQFINDAKKYFIDIYPFVNHDFNITNALYTKDNTWIFIDTDEIDYATRDQAKELYYNACNDLIVRTLHINPEFRIPEGYYKNSWLKTYTSNRVSYYAN